MSNIKKEDRVKLAVKNTLKGDITSEDIKAILRFQAKDITEMKSEELNNLALELLISHCITFN